MSYYRLRDIKTPPFAYVTNKDEVIRSCSGCQIPYPEPAETLEIEIFATETQGWQERIKGRPMMADLWLIGDIYFKEKLDDCLPGLFDHHPVQVVSWLVRRPALMVTDTGDNLVHNDPPEPPPYFYFRAKHSLGLDDALLESFPLMHCGICQREVTDIPLEYQRLPDLRGDQPPVAYLEYFHLEGYDYLFHKRIENVIRSNFPEMMLEELVSEPLVI